MIERRINERIEVDYWASLKHPFLGVVTGEIQDMSSSGISLTLDEEVDYYLMMELDVRIHGDGWDESMPALPVQVVRIQYREVALQFVDSYERLMSPSVDEMVDLEFGDGDALATLKDFSERVEAMSRGEKRLAQKARAALNNGIGQSQELKRIERIVERRRELN